MEEKKRTLELTQEQIGWLAVAVARAGIEDAKNGRMEQADIYEGILDQIFK